MIIDFHTHVFPPTICENREHYFGSEPAFALLYKSPKSKLIRAETLLEAMDSNGVEKSVIFGFPWNKAETFKKHNDYIADAVQRHADRLIGFCCFNPGSPEAVFETERCLAGGFAGVGELAFYQSGIDPTALAALAPIMEICRTRNRLVLIHTNEPVGHDYPGKTPNTLAQIQNLVKQFPNNQIVLAHWGGGIFFFSLLKKEVKDRLKNIYFDTAASPFLYDPAIYRLGVELAGVDKILFGSDYPLLNPARYFSEMEQAGLSQAELDRIWGLNAQTLLEDPF
ncbi:MAG: amidohydrolase family protein [Desulfobacterales bacterium]|nr:MAG: amidohydrolase family protein [Desulfobacterales bacterium]